VTEGLSSLRLVMQPQRGKIRWTLMKVHRYGTAGRDSILATGSAALDGVDLDDITARLILARVLDSLPPLAEPPAPPRGGHGGEATLDLDFSP
jgi:hypothetical protein